MLRGSGIVFLDRDVGFCDGNPETQQSRSVVSQVAGEVLIGRKKIFGPRIFRPIDSRQRDSIF